MATLEVQTSGPKGLVPDYSLEVQEQCLVHQVVSYATQLMYGTNHQDFSQFSSMPLYWASLGDDHLCDIFILLFDLVLYP